MIRKAFENAVILWLLCRNVRMLVSMGKSACIWDRGDYPGYELDMDRFVKEIMAQANRMGVCLEDPRMKP